MHPHCETTLIADEVMAGVELRDYVNERPRPKEEINTDSSPPVQRIWHLLLLSFGLLCIIQATLNLSLRITWVSSKESATTDCNTTHEKEVPTDCNEERPNHCNNLQERFNALTRDKDTLKNRNNILLNTIKSLEEERDRLKTKVKELSGCAIPQPCPAGWKEISSRCYFLSTESKTWQDSRQHCNRNGADPVVINGKQEQKALYRLDKDRSLVFWIGLRYVNSTYKWVDGSGLTETFLQMNPDHPGRANTQVCVVMDYSLPESQSWRVSPCERRHRWLCEKDLCAAS
ncbi:C-type lectin domain family 4 member E-like isoform X2 [Cololabis saira]|uniref:C-type lectin domain family 4 member E-like isoform X2 n=1 Tax=Cololabis saira TaxID=129043 RepID=UPI002AD59D9A|nr:C-type lectin domain family 4 member E-like isoform X2 [Cololabis saira]